MSAKLNRLNRMTVGVSRLPSVLRPWLLTFMFGRFVPFLATAGLHFDEVATSRLVVTLRNRRKVQNHIKGLHAAAQALLAETASGFVLALNVPDDKLMLLKSMKIDYLQRCQGDLRAVAILSQAQIEAVVREDKGDTLVEVSVTDESGQEPVRCEMVWAWLPKKR